MCYGSKFLKILLPIRELIEATVRTLRISWTVHVKVLRNRITSRNLPSDNGKVERWLKHLALTGNIEGNSRKHLAANMTSLKKWVKKQVPQTLGGVIKEQVHTNKVGWVIKTQQKGRVKSCWMSHFSLNFFESATR